MQERTHKLERLRLICCWSQLVERVADMGRRSNRNHYRGNLKHTNSRRGLLRVRPEVTRNRVEPFD